MSATSPQATAAPQTGPPTQMIFCPSCLTRMKTRANLPKGKKVRCPKCQQPVDPHSAAAVGSTRLKTKAAIEADAKDWPEWVWAIIIGVGNGLPFGAFFGFAMGVIFGSFLISAGDSLMLASVLSGTVAAVGYAVFGTGVALSMVFTGSSIVAYIVGVVLVIPAFFLFGWFGVLGTIMFVVLIERIVEWKIYS